MPLNEKLIKAKAAARRQAESYAEDLKEAARAVAKDLMAAETCREVLQDTFLEHLAPLVWKQTTPEPEVVPSLPMDDEDAKRFEKALVSFGKHEGCPVGEVEIGYLVWLEERSGFSRNLNRYLRSERGQRRQSE